MATNANYCIYNSKLCAYLMFANGILGNDVTFDIFGNFLLLLSRTSHECKAIIILVFFVDA